jgi:hypothetical protein
MMWQEVATSLVVLAALAYIVFKMGFASRLGRRIVRPDVPVSRLRKVRRIAPSCHDK